MEAVKEEVAATLQMHLAGLRARGEVVPIREHKRVETVEVSLEAGQPTEVTGELVPTSH